MSPAATPAEVTAAYRRFALRNHPDLGGDPERFRAGAEAYRRLLSGPSVRSTAAGGAHPDVVFHRRPRPGLSRALHRALSSARRAARARHVPPRPRS